MPIIWRYLLSHYLKVLFFCVISFIAVLLTTRLHEIAHFAALGAEGSYVFWFTLYQIPYILPIALPVSCLISSMILVQRLSGNHELTALRASGVSLQGIIIPLLLAASCLALFNFYLASEVATTAHLKSRVLEQELRSINPLVLLENHQLSKFKGIYANSMGESRVGDTASDIVVILPNKKNERLNVMLAKNIKKESSNLVADSVAQIHTQNSGEKGGFDHLIIENIQNSSTATQDFTQMLKKQSQGKIKPDYLKLSLLLLRMDEDLASLATAKSDPAQSNQINYYKKRVMKDLSEILRRLSIGIAILTFTLMGIAFGIHIGRKNSLRGVAWVVGLATLYLVSYFIAKGFEGLLIPSALLYTIPQIIILVLSMRALRNISKGIE